jgi:hypothetical protein
MDLHAAITMNLVTLVPRQTLQPQTKHLWYTLDHEDVIQIITAWQTIANADSTTHPRYDHDNQNNATKHHQPGAHNATTTGMTYWIFML